MQTRRNITPHWVTVILYLLLASVPARAVVDTATCEAALGVTTAECEGLVALYHSTQGDDWYGNLNWGTTNTPWWGIAVSGGHVIGIGLADNGLEGTLPAELGNLIYLEGLGLENNNIAGALPSELGQLVNLKFFFAAVNDLVGAIPVSFGNMQNLEYLDLQKNNLEGRIPGSLGNLTNLTFLRLNENRLSGQIPAQLGNLASLERLGLDHNRLSGTIPSRLGDLASLLSMDIAYNELIGAVPSTFTGLTSLRALGLNNNHLIADSSENALLSPALATWILGLNSFDISNQTPIALPEPQPAPVLSWWAMVLLSVLVGLVHKVQARRRH